MSFLRLKLLLPAILMYVLLAVVIQTFWGPMILGQHQASFVQSQKAVLEVLGRDLAPLLEVGKGPSLGRILDQRLEKSRADGWKQLELIDRDGRRLYPADEATNQDLHGVNKVVLKTSLESGGKRFADLVLVLDIEAELSQERQWLERLQWLILGLSVLIIVGTLIFHQLLVFKPLQMLKDAATRLSEGEFYSKLPKIGGDEVGRLTAAFELMRHNMLYDIRRREQAEGDLKQAYDDMEKRVEDRTRELQLANKKLGQEIVNHKLARERLRLTATVFDNTSEAIIVTDCDAKIVDVNEAFCVITGYQKEEVIGQDPSMQKSGRHDKAFYDAMWHTIRTEGRWKGEIWDKRKDGTVYPKWLTVNTVLDEEGGPTYYVGIFRDISDIKEAEHKLEQLAYYDVLTGCPNRYLFKERLQHELSVARRTSEKLALLFVDLDRFKQVNDTLGHKAGDELLKEVAHRLTSCVREEDTVARMGGDEFTVIINRIEEGQALERIVLAMLEELQAPVYLLERQETYIGGSIGIAICPDDGEDYEVLVKHADMAMYRAKEKRQGSFAYFHSDMNLAVERRLEMEASLRRGLSEREFLVRYQPKVNLEHGRIVGLEALVRWCQADGRLLLPDEFIPFAEETGLIVPLGEWVLRRACRDARSWIDEGFKDIRVAVNLSMVQFEQDNLIEMVQSALDEAGLEPRYLELEVTESVVTKDMEHAITLLSKLHQMGVAISIDDFGVGYSSLSYLKRLPIQSIKIDRSFVQDITTDPNDSAIVSAIISMAHDLSLVVLAEGVETEQQLSFLKQRYCSEIQGYLSGRPMRLDDAKGLLREND